MQERIFKTMRLATLALPSLLLGSSNLGGRIGKDTRFQWRIPVNTAMISVACSCQRGNGFSGVFLSTRQWFQWRVPVNTAMVSVAYSCQHGNET
jgi:hypothetical protein